MRDIAGRLALCRGAARARPIGDGPAGRISARLTDFCRDRPGRSVAVADLMPDGRMLGVGVTVDRPAASVAKLALVAALLASGADLAERVPLAATRPSKWPSVIDGLGAGEGVSLRALAGFAILTSDNPATELVLDRVGPAPVAAWLAGIGCSPATRFQVGFSDTALDDHGRVNRITIADCVRILRTLFWDDAYADLLGFMVNNIRNTRIPRLLPDTVWVAHKTGSLTGLVADVGIVLLETQPFILSVIVEEEGSAASIEIDIADLASDLVGIIQGAGC